MLAGGLRPLPGRLVTDSRSALGARRARPHATPFAQQHLKFHGPPNSGRSVAEWAPRLKKATGASRHSLQQRLPGAEGPPEGRSTAPRHAACGGPIPSSRGRVLITFLTHNSKIPRYVPGIRCADTASLERSHAGCGGSTRCRPVYNFAFHAASNPTDRTRCPVRRCILRLEPRPAAGHQFERRHCIIVSRIVRH